MDHHFIAELDESTIHLHDDLQFELKLEFSYDVTLEKNIFSQDFYIFIPGSLHINRETYSKTDFYLDQTNFIRYKTPDFTFEELLDPSCVKSPLNAIPLMQLTDEKVEEIIKEIKLFGNIFRSTSRDATLILIKKLEISQETQDFNSFKILNRQFTENIKITHSSFLKIKEQLLEKCSLSVLKDNLKYVDEFITNMIDYYLIGLLEKLRSVKSADLNECDEDICKIIMDEKKHLKSLIPHKKSQTIHEISEMIAYRQGLLQKFMIEALQLKSSRIAVSEQHGPFLGSIAAGLAMLVYMLLFLITWESPTFVIHSIPFIVSVVIFYILKDRIKEGVKSYYKSKSGAWFPDFRTKIYSPENALIGELTENFSFVDKAHIPEDIVKARNVGFHMHLENLHRHETVIRYKREVKLFKTKNKPLHELNMIFRYNIHRYLQKASDPIQFQGTLEEENHHLIVQKIPKVYHLNIVMQDSTSIKANKKSKIKKFRVIINKRGILQAENL
jgi:hypothetical protein